MPEQVTVLLEYEFVPLLKVKVVSTDTVEVPGLRNTKPRVMLFIVPLIFVVESSAVKSEDGIICGPSSILGRSL